ncbi:unnamed protein product [Amoebophrya sp. A25]|nr:unnamed protein product [Amoebophrya sp. A25]|eukprot:GSA25T00001820001.1
MDTKVEEQETLQNSRPSVFSVVSSLRKRPFLLQANLARSTGARLRVTRRRTSPRMWFDARTGSPSISGTCAAGKKRIVVDKYRVEPDIERMGLRFLGDSIEPDATYDPKLSRVCVEAECRAAQRKICAKILAYVSSKCLEKAKTGFPFTSFTVKKVLAAANASSQFGHINDEKTTSEHDSSWSRLFDFLPSLKPTLKGAGYAVGRSSKSVHGPDWGILITL